MPKANTSTPTSVESLPLKPIPSGKLRVQFQTIDQHLQAVSKIIGDDLDSPEQFILWNIISQMQDLHSHYDILADQEWTEKHGKMNMEALA